MEFEIKNTFTLWDLYEGNYKTLMNKIRDELTK